MKNFFATFLAAIIATIVCAQTSNPKDEGNYIIYIDTENGAYTGEFVL
ncbi:MAG: hypothetical protein IKA81_04955 [Alistipes sp.]|nr:hypothetical protein [Alistipes sp.]